MDENRILVRHSLQGLPLKRSIKAFCSGFPAPISCQLILVPCTLHLFDSGHAGPLRAVITDHRVRAAATGTTSSRHRVRRNPDTQILITKRQFFMFYFNVLPA
jgi:hypothetical protein